MTEIEPPVFETEGPFSPLLISVPHDGRHIPAPIAARMTEDALALPDTDWHVRRLYGFATGMGAGVIAATYARYVVDLNRAASDEALYAGAVNTGVVPERAFDGTPLYRDSSEPTATEVADRIPLYWQPYHDALAEMLAERRQRFGIAVLFEAHSIRSRVPRLFEGRLPDFNLGTNEGKSAAADLQDPVFNVLRNAKGYCAVVNDRFKGGHITRSFGAPEAGIHALQLEIAQSIYMDEDPPYAYDQTRATSAQTVLRGVVGAINSWLDQHVDKR